MGLCTAPPAQSDRGKDSQGKHPGVGLEEMNSSPLGVFSSPVRRWQKIRVKKEKGHRGRKGRSELLIAGKTPREPRASSGRGVQVGGNRIPQILMISVTHQHIPASHGHCPALGLEPGENPESPASPQCGFFGIILIPASVCRGLYEHLPCWFWDLSFFFFFCAFQGNHEDNGNCRNWGAGQEWGCRSGVRGGFGFI